MPELARGPGPALGLVAARGEGSLPTGHELAELMPEINARDRALLLAILQRNSGKGRWRRIRSWLEELGSVEALVEGQIPEHLDEDETPAVENRPADAEVVLVEDQLAAWTDEGIRVLTVLDRDYPVNLRTVYDRPPFLFMKGRLRDGCRRSVAVVGTRKASPEGLGDARRLAAHLAEHGMTVVSGLAAGVDTEAHETALEAGRDTVAVVGTGIRQCYPPQNRRLAREISCRGALLSQFWPDDGVQKWRFPARNLVMSGLTLATVVVEAGEKSGAKIQAEGALKHGRPVFLLRRLLTNEWAQKFSELPGVTVVRHVSDIYQPLRDLLEPAESVEFDQLQLA